MTWAALLALLLAFGILTCWVSDTWAWASLQVGLFALASAWTIASLRGRRLRFSPRMLPLAGILLWALVQLWTGNTIYRWGSWVSLLNWTTWAAVFFLSFQIMRDGDVRGWFLRAAGVFGLILSVVSTLQMFTSGGRIFWLFPSGFTDWVFGPFLNRNQYAAFMELLLPVTLVQTALDTKRSLFWSLAAGAIFASIIAASSRAGVILAGLEIVVILALRVLSHRTAAALALVAILCAAVVGMKTVRMRFTGPDPFAGRREMNLSSLHMIHDRPWTGFGLGTWGIVYPRYALYDDGTFVNQAHDDWAQWAVEGGIPFLVLVLTFFLPFMPAAVRSVWGIGMVAMLLHAMVDYPFQQRPALAACFFALLGALE